MENTPQGTVAKNTQIVTAFVGGITQQCVTQGNPYVGMAGHIDNCAGSKMRKRERKHTPITSERQRGKFGAELARRRKGMKSQMPDITDEELVSHLKEAKGKKLPKSA